MYRCKDCQKEYSQRVEYCDCGNNTFDYIEDIAVQKKPAKEPFTPKEKSAIISQIFFLVCLILSAVVWIIPVKTQTPVEEKPAQKLAETKAFPSIDKIWNSTPPKQELPTQTTQLPTPEPVAIATSTPAQQPQKPIQTKPAQTTQTKPVTTPKPVQTQTKPVQTTQTKSTPTQNSQTKPAQTTQTKPATQTQTKPAQTQTKPAQTTSSGQTQSSSQTKPQTQTQTKPTQTSTSQTSTQTPTKQETQTYNASSFEMLKYKGELRSAMFKKLPVGSIQGSGTCSVQFSIDSTGKLINRSFAQKSDNKTINDAVYYMMMSVPKFNPPPAEYNGSLIKMYFKFNDGSYEISIY